MLKLSGAIDDICNVDNMNDISYDDNTIICDDNKFFIIFGVNTDFCKVDKTDIISYVVSFINWKGDNDDI
jgi:hypothetical protein